MEVLGGGSTCTLWVGKMSLWEVGGQGIYGHMVGVPLSPRELWGGGWGSHCSLQWLKIPPPQPPLSYCFSEMAAVCAVVGGVLGQEVVKVGEQLFGEGEGHSFTPPPP